MIDLDDIDRALLRALARDANQSASALGRRLGLSQPATWRRIKRLEEGGAIAGRRLRLNAEALGFGVTVFLGIKLATHLPFAVAGHMPLLRMMEEERWHCSTR